MSEHGPALSPKLQELKAKYEADPGSRLFLQLAEEYRKAELHEEAVRVCRAGLEKHAGYTTARVTLARSLMTLKRLAEAQVELEAVIAAAGDNFLANRYLGDIYYEQGRRADALARYEMVQMLNPGDAEVSARVVELRGTQPTSAPAVTRARDIFGPRPSAAVPATPPPAVGGDDFGDFMDLKMDESVILNADMVQAALNAASAKDAEAAAAAYVAAPVSPMGVAPAQAAPPARVPPPTPEPPAAMVEDDAFDTPEGADDFSDFSSPTVMMSTADLARMAGLDPEPVAPPPSPQETPSAVPEPAAVGLAEKARERFGISSFSPDAAKAVGTSPAMSETDEPFADSAGLDDFSEFAAPTVMLNVNDLMAAGALEHRVAANGSGQAAAAGSTSPEVKVVAQTGSVAEARVEPLSMRVTAPPIEYGTHMIPIEDIERAARQAALTPEAAAPVSAPLPDLNAVAVDDSPLGIDESAPVFAQVDTEGDGDPFGQALEEEEPSTPPPSSADSLAGRTLGDLYLQQGHLEKALEVFERYLVERPEDDEIRGRVASIRARLRPAEARPPEMPIKPTEGPVSSHPPLTPAPPEAVQRVPGTVAVSPATESSGQGGDAPDDRKQKINKLSNWLASLKKS